jgi:poly-gamma-glutamate capsule biosynthesis protein CapA/YwtB (metallophosphatase superfamily)
VKFIDILKELFEEDDVTIKCKNEECGWSWKLSKGGDDPYTCHKCGEDNSDQMLMEKLCPKGKAYAERRKAAGEKHSAYLMGRAVQVCKGMIKEEDLEEDLHSWFNKEDWVRIDTEGNIAGPCGTMKKGSPTTRCLPRAKAERLTKAERAATTKKKVAASKKGKQFVSNTDKAKVSFKNRSKK